jgi:GT2 family glycosyltransferase
MPRCSIIIPVYNKASLTRQCLDVLLAQRPGAVECEFIVVDDCSTDGTPAMLGGYGDRIRIVWHPANVGFAASCNDGAEAASGEFLLFLNNDVIPHPGWLTALVRYAACHPEAAVVGSKLLFPNDTVQHAGVVICQDRIPRHIYTGFPAEHLAVNKSRPFQVVTGACMFIRRSRFTEAGSFDANFHNGYEDVDLCLRLGQLGHEVHYCHESVLYHLESASRKVGSKAEHDNTQLYLDRWADRVRPDELHYYIEDGLFSVTHSPSYPVTFVVSPLLALMKGEDGDADRLLRHRTRQVFELLKDNIRLNVRLQEAEFRPQAVPVNGAANGASPGPRQQK